MTKVLVDTSIWVDHLNNDDPNLRSLLEQGSVVTHEMIVGEIACGSLKERAKTLASMDSISTIPKMSSMQVRQFIEDHSLFSKGIGWVDLHLLSAASEAGVSIWTNDGKLADAAKLMNCHHELAAN